MCNSRMHKHWLEWPNTHQCISPTKPFVGFIGWMIFFIIIILTSTLFIALFSPTPINLFFKFFFGCFLFFPSFSPPCCLFFSLTFAFFWDFFGVFFWFFLISFSLLYFLLFYLCWNFQFEAQKRFGMNCSLEQERDMDKKYNLG